MALLIVGLLTLLSFGQENPPKEAPPKAQPETLGPGDHTRSLNVGDLKRTYLAHVPKGYDLKKPAPVVLALHGAAMNGSMMVWFSGLNKKSDEAGFIVIYPSGTGTGPFLTWNAGGFKGKKADDVAFIGKLPIQTWVKLNGCDEKPKTDVLSKDGEEMKVTRKTYGGKDGAEVVLVVIEEGGHTWPGMTLLVITVGQPVEGREKRRVKLIDAKK